MIDFMMSYILVNQDSEILIYSGFQKGIRCNYIFSKSWITKYKLVMNNKKSYSIFLY